LISWRHRAISPTTARRLAIWALSQISGVLLPPAKGGDIVINQFGPQLPIPEYILVKTCKWGGNYLFVQYQFQTFRGRVLLFAGVPNVPDTRCVIQEHKLQGAFYFHFVDIMVTNISKNA